MSTRHSITLCREAAQAGADVAIIIPNAYYGAAMSTPDGKKHLRDFYIDISNNSPIPVSALHATHFRDGHMIGA